MPTLLILEGSYYYKSDEQHFFEWLQSIPGVRRVKGTANGLLVSLRSSTPSDFALRELLALHWRYRLPMKELSRFRTPKNDSWFADPIAYWHASVFGERAVSPYLEARLKELRAEDVTPVQAIKVLCVEYGFSLAEAKRRFSLSPAWSAHTRASSSLQLEAMRIVARRARRAGDGAA